MELRSAIDRSACMLRRSTQKAKCPGSNMNNDRVVLHACEKTSFDGGESQAGLGKGSSIVAA